MHRKDKSNYSFFRLGRGPNANALPAGFIPVRRMLSPSRRDLAVLMHFMGPEPRVLLYKRKELLDY